MRFETWLEVDLENGEFCVNFHTDGRFVPV